ncbi:MAG: response regulator [Saprospiraceae bacterium]|nr:response regulator [Pyrinomonadaceae bacterium]
MSDHSARILCVDDNRDSLEMIKALLSYEDESYDVTAVETAAEALQLVAKNRFDLYVLDLWLASMDGMELCRRIRAMKVTEPIIFFSAMGRPADMDYVFAAGANEYLTKPNDLGIFAATVKRLLSGSESVPV